MQAWDLCAHGTESVASDNLAAMPVPVGRGTLEATYPAHSEWFVACYTFVEGGPHGTRPWLPPDPTPIDVTQEGADGHYRFREAPLLEPAARPRPVPGSVNVTPSCHAFFRLPLLPRLRRALIVVCPAEL
jgi:hypothetical protein